MTFPMTLGLVGLVVWKLDHLGRDQMLRAGLPL